MCMATARTRRERSPANPVVAALSWLWSLALSLLFVALGLALVGGGLLFAFVGAQELLNPEDAGHTVAAVLFIVLGVAAAVGGVALVFRWRSRLVLRLSGRRPPSPGGNDGGWYVGSGFFGGDGGGDGGGGDGGGSC